jgi:ribonuclease BN (tRNA processing enzyme)
MADTDYITFMGTAGARFVVAEQLRASAGVYLHMGGRHILLDPGPGALVACASHEPRIDPAELDAIILTHAHIDHSGDVNALIDAMTAGGWRRRGDVFAPAECLDGPHQVLLNYLRGFPTRLVSLEAEGSYSTQNVSFTTSCPHVHGRETYGIKFQLPGGRVSFVADTAWFDELPANYADSDVLIVNVVLLEPAHSDRIKHLSTTDAERLVNAVRPRLTVMTHFGHKLLAAGPERIAEGIADRSGCPVVAARDGMRLLLPAEGMQSVV